MSIPITNETFEPVAPGSMRSKRRAFVALVAAAALATLAVSVQTANATTVLPNGHLPGLVSPPKTGATQWPALSGMQIDRAVPGLVAHAGTRFSVATAGTITLATPTGSTFSADGLSSFRVETETVDTSELGRGKGVRPPIVAIWVLDQHVDGAGPLTVDAGEEVVINTAVRAGADGPSAGELNVSFNGVTVAVPITMFVADVTPSIGARAVTVTQGQTIAVPVAVRSNAGPATDTSYAVTGSAAGMTVAGTTIHVAHGGTAVGAIRVSVGRDAPVGRVHYDIVATAFNDRQRVDLGGLDVIVTARPTIDLNVDLGVAEREWNSHLDFLCDRLRDGAGRAVQAFVGRSIRDPQCHLSPIVLKATPTPDGLVLMGHEEGNWISFYVTTPDGIPGFLDPKFQVDFGVDFSINVPLPSTLNGNTVVRVGRSTVQVTGAKVDSHNLSADLVKAAVMAFGDGSAFHAADYGFNAEADALGATVNAALAALDQPMQSAIAVSGLTSLGSHLDPSGYVVTLHLS